MKSPVYMLLFIFLLSIGCHLLDGPVRDTNRVALARVGDEYLYLEDVQSIVIGANPDDSTKLVNQYVYKWIQQKLVMEKAVANLPSELQDVDKQVEDYKQSLLIYLYETYLVNQKLDTTISQTEIKDYYHEYKDNFELRYDVARIRYLILPSASPNMDSVLIWINSNSDASRSKLVDYGYQYAMNFSVNDSVWLETNLLASRLSLDESVISEVFNSGAPGIIEDSLRTFVIQVKDLINKGSLAPLSYVHKDIREILLNKRKVNLVEETYAEIYKEAQSQGAFERF